MKTRIRLKKQILKQLGSNIKQIRMSKGVTQEELAELIEVDRSYIGAIEQGRKSPSIYCLFTIAFALKVKFVELTDINI